MSRHTQAVRTPLLWLALLCVSACSTPAAYRDPIAKYQLASTVVIESARVEYAGANDRERKAFVDRATQDQRRLDLAALDDDSLRVLGDKDIAARMSALNALAKHGQLLMALASSDAPERARGAANSLGEAVADLQKSLDASGSGEFKDKATGFAAIAGEIVNLVMEKRITEALDRAILASERDVQGLIKLIRRDMSLLYERKKTILNNERVAAVDAYNAALKAPVDRGNLRSAAETILKTEAAWDRLTLLRGTAPSLDAMAEAHTELVAYANSSKKPQDLASLVEAIEIFVARVSIIADSIRRIKDN